MADSKPHDQPPPTGDAPQKILPRDIEEEMRESYLNYAMSVIVSRALPDVRDGMKPSQRRVIFTMHELNLTPRAAFKKCARVVGDCMGKYHPHGDDPIYGTLVRLAQDFSSRYPLADGHGNFGSIAEPSPAAMRYTEVRMAQAAVDMVEDIDRETVEMVPNFDESLQEPTVLPAKFPNLICNGSQGIAVGMATSIPPHNLSEVTDALVALIDTPQIRDEQLIAKIPGPDFPTGGTIMGVAAIKQAYLTGRGNITVRGKVEIDEKGDKATITIKELPYQVTTEILTEKLIEAVKAERIQGIATVRDRTKIAPNIQIELKKGEDPNVILNQLWKYTPLQSSFSVILLALDKDRRPRTFTLRELLLSFKDHRFDVIRRRTTFLLRKALERIHILEGLRKALDAIDDVVAIIRKSPDTDTARAALMKRLEITDRQADAILDMRLARLTGLEQKKLDEELDGLRKEAADYRDILARDERVNGIIKTELLEMKKKYGDARRTTIEAGEAEEIDIEDLIPQETVIVTVSHEGYVKRSPIDTYRSQHRGGKGVTGAATKEGDFVERVFTASTHDYLLCFTDKGRVFWLKVYSIPEMSRTARGRALQNLMRLLPNEIVTEIVAISGEFDETRELVMVTSKGVIKKTKLSMFKNPKKTGIVAVKLDDGDRLIGVRLTDGKRELVLASKGGQAIRFQEEHVRSMGRNARGVRGMTLENDELRSLVVVGEDGPTILTVCERGYGKRTPIDDYRVTNRGGKGIINIKTTERNGQVVYVVAVRDDDEVILVTSSGKLIRTRCADVPTIGRNTQGVRLIRLEEGDRVVAVAKVVKGEEAGEVATPDKVDAAEASASAAADEAESVEPDAPAPDDDGADDDEGDDVE